jgi:transcriptional regulator with XRE-family HTH domain
MAEDRSPGARRKAFGVALASARSVRGVTQRSLGELLGGTTQSAISAWEAGEAEPAPDTVFTVEQALELPGGHLSRILGYLPASTDGVKASSVPDAVVADPLLDDLQKRGIIALYRELTGQRKSRR